MILHIIDLKNKIKAQEYFNWLSEYERHPTAELVSKLYNLALSDDESDDSSEIVERLLFPSP